MRMVDQPTDSALSDVDGHHHAVVVVGGGQAGLSMSWLLTERGIDHVVLERNRVGGEWRDHRWETFCLVTPNWQCQLPGFPYQGDDPDGFMVRDQIIEYLERYARSFPVPLVEGVEAVSLRRAADGVFQLGTSAGRLTADQVVLATGPYQVPLRPRMAERLPAGIAQLHSSEYRSPDQLPPGPVLVVGTGQSGCQIAEDLHLAGREVHLATGGAPRVARFYRGRDVVTWLHDMGYYQRGIDQFDDADAVRFRANHYVTGRDGGRDIDLRLFAAQGMRLYGRLTGISGAHLDFDTNLKSNLDSADAVSESIKDSVDRWIEQQGIDAPTEARYVPVWTPEAEQTELDLADARISTVIWCTGFGRDHRWIELPIFDGRGYPTHERGVSSCPGLYLLGLPWQYTWGSGRFSGVAADAEHLAEQIVAARHRRLAGGVHWIAGTPNSTYPRDEDWTAPRTVA
ncbi:MAG TPA: MSMEG_0569 family flavin-dependent oxidoreductase [Pseudonocardiaceae bacterium]|jgi:putative flavoprotein involved in K+ transport|nr:MSMEG_0569 family flavin-dependent oxidoreductase [Pseudonocardiaceae bacterium]